MHLKQRHLVFSRTWSRKVWYTAPKTTGFSVSRTWSHEVWCTAHKTMGLCSVFAQLEPWRMMYFAPKTTGFSVFAYLEPWSIWCSAPKTTGFSIFAYLKPWLVGTSWNNLSDQFTELVVVCPLLAVRDPEDPVGRSPVRDEVHHGRLRAPLGQPSHQQATWDSKDDYFMSSLQGRNCVIFLPCEIPTPLYPPAINGSACMIFVNQS
jgi:hypothetical protein